MNITISGYSTALFSTWYFLEEIGVLFDAGDGVTASLLQKSRKIENVFISHADRDHLSGLLQLNQLNARSGYPIIHYPKDCGSFPAMASFSKQFDPHAIGTAWTPVVDGEKIWIRKDIYVQAIANNHVPAPDGIYKSLGYKVVLVKKKLHADLIHMNPLDIRKTIAEKGYDNTHTETLSTLVCYSGDTPVENFEHWNNADVLIHEATFLGEATDNATPGLGNKHSNLEDVIRAVSTININKLILGHFSSRYADADIDIAIKTWCSKYGITIPVFRLLPGQAVKNILGQTSLNPNSGN